MQGPGELLVQGTSGRPIGPLAPGAHGMEAAAQYYYARDYDEAQRCCLELIERDSQHFDALHLLGVICLHSKQLPDAVAYLTRAATIRQDDAHVHYHRGTALLQLRLYEQAEDALRRAVELRPDDDGYGVNLGNAIAGQGRHEEALACFQRVLSKQPDNAPALYNIGRSLVSLGRPNEAISIFRTALSYASSSAELDRLADIYASLGGALVELRRYDEALATFRAMAGVRPQAAQWNESLALLLLGEYDEGWRKYEGRWGIFDHDPPRADACILNLAEVAGKRILLTSEQGRGDMIQFARYAPLLARLGAHVTLECYVELKPLMTTLDGIDAVIAGDEPEPPYDLVTPLLSLPLAFGTRVSTIPADVPYLHVHDDRLAAWRQRLGQRRSPRIGIAWSGAVESRHDDSRPIPLARLAPLLQLPGFEFHSIQKDVRSSDLSWLVQNPIFTHHGDALHDFADAAALVSLMDLVISIDTAGAHLTGALGKPVWIMLAFSADWRWFLDRDDSPWYPTARLFRQRQPGDWEGVIATIISALRQLPAPAQT